MNLFKKRVLRLINVFMRYCENRKRIIYSKTPDISVDSDFCANLKHDIILNLDEDNCAQKLSNRSEKRR